MRNKIFGGIGLIWGGALVVYWLMSDQSAGTSTHQTDSSFGVILGALIFVTSLYYFFKK